MPILESMKSNINFIFGIVVFCSAMFGGVVTIYDRSESSKEKYITLQVANITKSICELTDDTKEIKNNVVKIKTDVAVIKSKQSAEDSRLAKLEEEVHMYYIKGVQ